MVKICNKCGFQQYEFLYMGGKKYCNGCNSEIKNNDNRKQDAITISAYELETTYEFLYGALEWLELYIERAHPDWQQKKQLPKNITRPDLPSFDAEEMRGHFRTSLMGLRSITFNKPQFLLEGLQTEFFSWFDNSGININNCSDKLSQELIDFHSILVGKGESFAKRKRKETDEEIAKMTPEERKKNFREIVAAYQKPLENEDKVFEVMKGKTYKDVNGESRFNGNADRGSEIFKQIERKFDNQEGVGVYNQIPQNNSQQQSPHLLSDRGLVVNDELYDEVWNVPLSQEDINSIRYQQQILSPNSQSLIGTSGGSIALVMGLGVRFFSKSLR